MKDKRFWVALAVFVLYSLFYWPTPYTYLENSQGWHVRANRVTGEVQVLGKQGWYSHPLPVNALETYDQVMNGIQGVTGGRK